MDLLGTDLKTYFATTEQLVGQQIAAADDQLDRLTDEIVALQREKAAKSLKAGEPLTGQSPELVSLTSGVKSQLAITNQLKGELAARKASLEAADARFLTTYTTLLEAQKRLDQYLQLEHADERLFNELLSQVGVSRTQFDGALDAAQDAAKSVDDTLRKVERLKTAVSS